MIPSKAGGGGWGKEKNEEEHENERGLFKQEDEGWWTEFIQSQAENEVDAARDREEEVLLLLLPLHLFGRKWMYDFQGKAVNDVRYVDAERGGGGLDVDAERGGGEPHLQSKCLFLMQGHVHIG
jgi:hypothetical protein